MSSIAAISSSAFDSTVLIDEQIAPISEHFLEKINYQTIDKIKRITSLLYFIASFVAVVVAAYYPIMPIGGLFAAIYHMFFAEVVWLSIWANSPTYVWHKGYRQQIRQELLDGKIKLPDFLNKHSWQEIRIWGLFLPEKNHPLVTKTELVDLFLKSLSHWWMNNRIVQKEYFLERRSFWNESGDTYEILKQFADHNITFTPEQKKLFAEKCFARINQESDVVLVQYFEVLDQLGLLDNMETKRKENLERKTHLFKKIWEQYVVVRDVILQKQTQGNFLLPDICGVHRSYELDLSKRPEEGASRQRFYAKHFALINEWFIDQMGALA